jgi:hypothetical protein
VNEVPVFPTIPVVAAFILFASAMVYPLSWETIFCILSRGIFSLEVVDEIYILFP